MQTAGTTDVVLAKVSNRIHLAKGGLSTAIPPQTIALDADSEAEAIFKVYNGQADLEEDSTEYIETADKYGMGGEENQRVIQELSDLGLSLSDFIPSIRSMTKGSE